MKSLPESFRVGRQRPCTRQPRPSPLDNSAPELPLKSRVSGGSAGRRTPSRAGGGRAARPAYRSEVRNEREMKGQRGRRTPSRPRPRPARRSDGAGLGRPSRLGNGRRGPAAPAQSPIRRRPPPGPGPGSQGPGPRELGGPQQEGPAGGRRRIETRSSSAVTNLSCCLREAPPVGGATRRGSGGCPLGATTRPQTRPLVNGINRLKKSV